MNLNESVFESFPVLQTKNLILREITLEDAENIFNIYSDPVAMKYFGKVPYNNFEQANEMINKVITNFRERNGIRWAITFNHSNELIGTGGFWRLVKDHFRAEIGYDLSVQHWRKGVMNEALTSIINYGFNELNLHTIEANVDPENIASIKLLEKLQFKKEGHTRESYYFDGKYTDTAIYCIVNPNK